MLPFMIASMIIRVFALPLAGYVKRFAVYGNSGLSLKFALIKIGQR